MNIPAGTNVSTSAGNYVGDYSCTYTADIVISGSTITATETSPASNPPSVGPPGSNCGKSFDPPGTRTYTFAAVGVGYVLTSGSSVATLGPSNSHAACPAAAAEDMSAADAARGGVLSMMAAGATAALLL